VIVCRNERLNRVLFLFVTKGVSRDLFLDVMRHKSRLALLALPIWEDTVGRLPEGLPSLFSLTFVGIEVDSVSTVLDSSRFEDMELVPYETWFSLERDE